MLKIVKSGFYSAGKEQLYSEVKELAQKGSPALLIVPEQQTVLTEGALSRVIPPSATPFFEVTNFKTRKHGIPRLRRTFGRILRWGEIGTYYVENSDRAFTRAHADLGKARGKRRTRKHNAARSIRNAEPWYPPG